MNVREWRRDYDRATKIPPELAVALAKATAEGETAWERTRPEGDWETFKPFLVTVVALKREEAQALGYAAEPYDAHLDLFEPGETAAGLAPLLEELRVSLLRVLDAVQGSGRRPQSEVVRRHFPVEAQERLARLAAQSLGYDFAGGRLDKTAHPFSTDIGPGDVRITTRFDEHRFSQAFFGTLHETGHALYDQGLPADALGRPPGRHRLPGHPRIPVPAVGKPGGALPGLLAFFLSPGSGVLSRPPGRAPRNLSLCHQ